MKVTDFQDISYSSEWGILYIKVNEKTVEMNDDDFKAAQWEIIRQIEVYRPKKILTDLRKLAFTISIAMQRWQGEVIAPEVAKNGVKIAAYIMPQEFFVQLGVELTVDELIEGNEQLNNPLVIRYFEGFETAEEWLKS
jgi:hypothetical protein